MNNYALKSMNSTRKKHLFSYRSSSADLSTPRTPTLGMRSSDYTMPSPRARDRSMDYTLPRSTRSSDFSINGIERMRSRPRIVVRDEEEHSQEYKNILARAGNIKDRDIMKVTRSETYQV